MTSSRLWFRDDAVKHFLDVMNIEADPIHELDRFLKTIEQLNPRYKGGRDLVRFQLEENANDWPPGVASATMILAKTFLMCHGETPLPSREEWDMIIALGGARRSILNRATYAAQAIKEGRADARILAIAGSTRPLLEKEIELTRDFAPDARTEYDLCVGAAGHIRKRNPEINIITVCEDNPRSGNDGVIDATIATCGNDLDNQTSLKIAAVTTRIYVVGLGLDMARAALRHGWRAHFAAGHASDPEVVYNRSTATYLSEVLTTLRKIALAAAEGC